MCPRNSDPRHEQKAYDPYGSPNDGGNSEETDQDDPGTGDPTPSPSPTEDPTDEVDPATDDPEDESELGFQAANTDKVSGNVLLGPRQYDPETERFTTADTFVASGIDMQLGTDPLTGNRYLFAAANPVAFYENGYEPCPKGANCNKMYSGSGTGGRGGNPPADPRETRNIITEIEPTIQAVSRLFGVPPSVIAGTLATEETLDARSEREVDLEGVIAAGVCAHTLGLRIKTEECYEFSVGIGQMQLRRAALVDAKVQEALNMSWKPTLSRLVKNLRHTDYSITYVGAYLDVLRDHHVIRKPSATWAEIYGTRKPLVGEYNANDDFIEMFQASRNYYSYLDS